MLRDTSLCAKEGNSWPGWHKAISHSKAICQGFEVCQRGRFITMGRYWPLVAGISAAARCHTHARASGWESIVLGTKAQAGRPNGSGQGGQMLAVHMGSTH